MENQQINLQYQNNMKLPKNAIQLILAASSVLFTFAWFVTLLFVEIPEKNQGNIDMFSGALITTCLGLVMNYYFSSSKGSQDKTDMLNPNKDVG